MYKFWVEFFDLRYGDRRHGDIYIVQAQNSQAARKAIISYLDNLILLLHWEEYTLEEVAA